MKRLACCILLAPLVATAAAAEDFRQLTETFPVPPGRALHLDLPSGDLKVLAGSKNEVEVDLQLVCRFGRRHCSDVLSGARVVARESARRVSVRSEGIPAWRLPELRIEGTVVVPAAAALSVDMGAGALAIEGVTGDLEVDLGAGAVTLRLPLAAVKSAALDVTAGEAEIFAPDAHLTGRRSLLIGSEAYWSDGPGQARVTVNLGAGEITLFLE